MPRRPPPSSSATRPTAAAPAASAPPAQAAGRTARVRPDFSLENAAGMHTPVCGVDEVGRGPIAGPVTAAAVILPRNLPDSVRDAIDDSKRLNDAQRAALAPLIRQHAVAWAVAEAGLEEIERLNILHAAMLAMSRAVAALGQVPALILVDGNRVPPDLPCPARPVVKGDSRSLSIAAASVLAKVDRDAVMVRLDAEFPGYDWAANAGYPTPGHLAALRRLGVSPWHRRGFGPVKAMLTGGEPSDG